MKKRLAAAFLTLFSMVSYAQSDLPQIIPPNPNTAKLVQFDITPTTPYTGKQNLGVPLYNIEFDGAQFPISINYASGGIRTTEEAGFVGLGWGFSYGGTISRSVKGYNDFYSGNGLTGYINDPQSMISSYDPVVDLGNGVFEGQIDGQNYLSSPFWAYIASGLLRDTEPDIFNYNFMGLNGSFILSKKSENNGVAEPIKLTADAAKIAFNEPNKTFTVTTPSGFVGTFDVKEWVTSIGGSDNTNGKLGCDVNKVDILQVFNSGKRAITTWYLSKVTSPNGRELNFEYDIKSNGYSDFVSQSAKSFSERKSLTETGTTSEEAEAQNYTQSCSFTVIEHVYPKRIYSSYNGIDVNFTKTARADVAAMTTYMTEFAAQRGEASFTVNPPQRITGLTVGSTNQRSSLNHTISFSQSYFNPNASNPYQFKRLKLDGVTMDDQVYSFEYEDGLNGLPDKSTFGVDYWGYYNGKDQNTVLLPVAIGYETVLRFSGPSFNTYSPNHMFYYQTDARKANFDYGKAGILKKVTYPTGGSTEFEYEPHSYRLTGKEIVPSNSTFIESISPSVSSVNTVESPPFFFSGFLLAGGSCNATMQINMSIKFKDFFLTAPEVPFEVPLGDYSIAGAELVNASTGLTVESFLFGHLGDAAQEEPPRLSISVKPSGFLPAGNYFLRARTRKHVIPKEEANTVEDVTMYYYGDVSVSFPSECTSISSPVPVTTIVDVETGGGRIKTITNYDRTNSIAAKRTYDYSDHAGLGGASTTGKLMNPLMNFSISNIGSDHNYYVFSSNTVLSDGAAAQGSHIGYSAVREKYEGSGSGNIGFKDYVYLNQPNDQGYYGLSSSTVYANTNGQIDRALTYSAGLVEQARVDYNDHSDDLGTINAVKVDWNGLTPGIMETYKLKQQFVRPKQVVSETKLNGETMTQITNYTFNNDYQLKSETTTDSNGDVLLKEYRYAADIVNPGVVVSGMKSKNFIAYPIEQTTKVNGTVISSAGTEYKLEGNNYLPKKVYVQNNDVGSFSATSNGEAFGGGYESRVEYRLYDGNGNIREFVNSAGVSTTVLWGYGGVYPVAQIENATYAEVALLINQSSLDSPGSQGALRNTLGALRTNLALKNALVTTMTFDPGVGMLSQTSPNGLTVYYEYDNYGRLKYIKDQDGNILSMSEYAYKVPVSTVQN